MQDGEKLADAHHRHAPLLHTSHQLQVTFEIVIAADGVLRFPEKRGLKHNVIRLVTTQPKFASGLHLQGPLVQQGGKFGDIDCREPVLPHQPWS